MTKRQTATITAFILSGFLLPNVQGMVAPSPPGYKYRVARQVCQQLATAFGEGRLPKLTMVTDPNSQRIAQFVARPEAELFLDEKLYDICRGFGPDSLSALAIVLGHELTHYYGKHADWFGFAQLNKRQQPTPLQAEQTQVLEAQADMQGVYRAFLAGYDAYRLAKPVYTAIYTAYQLPIHMTGYPSRDERIRLMDEQAQKAHTLAMAFETGLFFFLNRDYTVAQRCFDFVTEEIPTKELLVNMGLCQVLRATQVMTVHEMPFRYPFEIETGNRLRPDQSRGEEINKATLLKQAIAYFRQALDIDETYTAAAINLAAAQSMLGRTGTAKETIDQLEEALGQTHESLPPNARMLRGIALVEAGKIPEGLAELDRSTGAYELAYNQKIARVYARLNGQTTQAATQLLAQVTDPQSPSVVTRPLVQETGLGKLRLPFTPTTPLPDRLAIPEPGLVRIQSARLPEGTLYRITLASGSYELIVSQPGSGESSRLGIKSGDSAQAIVRQYGDPQRVVPAADGLTYYCYDRAHFFVAIQNGAVRNWFLYTSL